MPRLHIKRPAMIKIRPQHVADFIPANGTNGVVAIFGPEFFGIFMRACNKSFAMIGMQNARFPVTLDVMPGNQAFDDILGLLGNIP